VFDASAAAIGRPSRFDFQVSEKPEATIGPYVAVAHGALVITVAERTVFAATTATLAELNAFVALS
jgi:hypothetical protein